MGGACVLSVCNEASPSCAANERCAPVDLCVIEQVRTWGYGALPVSRNNALAAPPFQFAVPQHDFLAADVCGPGSTCNPGKCEALHVCLPQGRDRPATAAKARHPTEAALVRTVSETELKKSEAGAPPIGGAADAPASEIAASGPDAASAPGGASAGRAPADLPNEAPRRGGFLGCVTASAGTEDAWLGLAFVALGAVALRRRRS
jgi:MYXO-CTERM domain-containing protein